MAYDHSQTYRRLSVRNVGHIWRAAAIMRTVGRLSLPRPLTYFDVGCSNGYLTAKVSQRLNPYKVIGWDHTEENLAVARKTYPDFQFRYVDLNKPVSTDCFADFITCFETMEHVGSTRMALDNLKRMSRPNGVVLITVPIEVGLIGAAKFIVKTGVFGYTLNEISDSRSIQREYRRAVFTGADISRFRADRNGWGTHFGFDHRAFEREVRERFNEVRAWTSGTSKFISARNVAS